jgi:tetratricopeptide (TPR) repeat protein
VVSRTSSFQFKGQSTDVREIGEKLNVQTVLEGSVRKAGDLLRITVQHIDVADGYHIWSERYDRRLDDVFAIQDEISQKILEHLRANLLPGEGPKAGARRASSVEAYNLYLKGRFHLNQRTKEGILASVNEFEQACCQDCTFALPFAGLAEAQLLVAAHAIGAPGERDEMLAQARAAAQEAIRQDEACAEAHVALGMVHARADWNWKAAEEEFKKAIALNDGLALAHHQYAMYLSLRRRPDEAVREIRRAFELDPLSPLINSAVGRVLYFAGRYEESIEQLRRTIELYPDYGNAYFDLGVTLARVGRYDEAREVVARLDALQPGDVRAKIVAGWVDAASGNEDKARAVLKEIEAEIPAPPMSMAVIYAGLGEVDQALSALEAALEERDLTLPYVGVESAYDPLRGDPRMDAILDKLGLND